MKKITIYIFMSFMVAVSFLSCKKEKSSEGCINGNKPPIAVAGPDQVITLPTDSISLNGSTSNDPDGMISEWLWTKISGPASFNIISASTAKTAVKNLTVGTYQFELKVTDDKGLTAKDTMQVTVNSTTPTNQPPVANAGPDQTITLPTNSVNLDGSASTDPDNNITSYLWIKITGPSSFNITNANAMQAQVTNLAQGIYQFELKVTDAGGLFSKDTMQVNVNTQPSPPNNSCPPTNRPIINAQLIPVGNLSIARDGIATVSAGNKLFFAGGYNASGPLSRVDIFDLTTNTWSITELSIARARMSAVSLGNKVFFAGGYYNGPLFSRVDIYDLNTQTWSIAELSQARAYIETATVGNKVFFAGGTTNGSDNSSVIDIYDISTNIWSTANLSEARIGFTATTADNKIYFAGGWNGIGGTMNSNKIDIYDNATGSWLTSTLGSPKAYHASIFKNGKIYWAGGWTKGNGEGDNDFITCEVEIRDINTQTSSFTNLFEPTAYINAFEKDNKILYLQGFGPYNTPAYFDIHDLISDTWSIGVLNQQGLFDTGCILSHNNIIYVAGGSLDNGGGGGFYTSQVWKLEF